MTDSRKANYEQHKKKGGLTACIPKGYKQKEHTKDIVKCPVQNRFTVYC